MVPSGVECDSVRLLPAGCLPRRDNQLEVAVIEANLAVSTRGGQPIIGGECDTVDIVAIVCVAVGLSPLPVTVINVETLPCCKPGRQIAAAR